MIKGIFIIKMIVEMFYVARGSYSLMIYMTWFLSSMCIAYLVGNKLEEEGWIWTLIWKMKQINIDWEDKFLFLIGICVPYYWWIRGLRKEVIKGDLTKQEALNLLS